MFLIGFPLSFHFVLGIYIYVIDFSKLSLMPETIPAIDLPEKCIIHTSRCLHIISWFAHSKLN